MSSHCATHNNILKRGTNSNATNKKINDLRHLLSAGQLSQTSNATEPTNLQLNINETYGLVVVWFVLYVVIVMLFFFCEYIFFCFPKTTWLLENISTMTCSCIQKLSGKMYNCKCGFVVVLTVCFISVVSFIFWAVLVLLCNVSFRLSLTNALEMKLILFLVY